MKNNYVDVWNEMHKEFAKKDIVKYDNWLDEYKDIIANIDTEIIDLGCGVTGNNTIYLLGVLLVMPLEDNCTNLVIADLSLHYFKDEDTKKIIKEIQRILKPNGYLFIRVNSTHSKEYQSILENNLEPIEQHLFFRKGMEKRFFDEDDIKNYFNDFEIIDMQEENMNRWSPDKIVWKCIFKNK